MDIATIAIKVAGDAVPVPGLKSAATLVLEIMNASGEQTERLNDLVRTTGRRLVAFHDQLRGKWENIPDNFKTILDDYQNALEDVLALARSYTPRRGLKAHDVSWMRQRDKSIAKLERRLEEAEKEAMLVAVDDPRMDDIILDSFSSVTGRGRNDISEHSCNKATVSRMAGAMAQHGLKNQLSSLIYFVGMGRVQNSNMYLSENIPYHAGGDADS
ncbi:hypothetical protein BU17DRAFT_63831 [Hysterangium stoloniferum]|nr:hypothetical protein BU17DRAFT_63831 [Hysterangium stoloniferum]